MSKRININPSDIQYMGYVVYKGAPWPVYSVTGYDTYNSLISIMPSDGLIIFDLQKNLFPLPLLQGIPKYVAQELLQWYGSGADKSVKPYYKTYGETEISYSYETSNGAFSGDLVYKPGSAAHFMEIRYEQNPANPPFYWISSWSFLLYYNTSSGINYVLCEAILHLAYDEVSSSFGNYFYINTTSSPQTGYQYWFPSFTNKLLNEASDIEIKDGVPDGSDNPYAPGGESGPGGGDGDFDLDSDPIGDSPLPTLSSANTGFTRIYNPTLSQLQDLANYLWTDESVITTIWNHIKQYFEDPMQAIIGLNLVPVTVPDAGSKNFALMFIDTGVSMNVAATQFVDVDCGTLDINKYYGSALDYSPYTRIQCFLPFVGMINLNVDEVMGRNLQVKYRVDIASGSCTCKIFVDGNVLYQYSGHCAIPVPFSSADFSSYIGSAISVAQLAGTAALAGSGIISPPPPTVVTQQTNKTVTNEIRDTARNQATGRQITTKTSSSTTSEDTTKETSTQASFAGLTPANVTNTAGEVLGSKTHIEHSGSFSGNSGYLGVRYPYVIITRPNMCMPGQYQHFNGFPCMMNLLLGDCSGFTRVQQVQLTGLDATNPEQAEILELLKMGVYL